MGYIYRRLLLYPLQPWQFGVLSGSAPRHEEGVTCTSPQWFPDATGGLQMWFTTEGTAECPQVSDLPSKAGSIRSMRIPSPEKSPVSALGPDIEQCRVLLEANWKRGAVIIWHQLKQKPNLDECLILKVNSLIFFFFFFFSFASQGPSRVLSDFGNLLHILGPGAWF